MTDPALRILLVEDNPAEASSLAELLETALPHARVEITGTMAAALERLSPLPDLILLDLGLPDSSSQASYTTLHERAPLTPVVVLTGSNDEEMAQSLIRYGAQDYLVKGEISGSLVVRSIRHALDRSRLLRDLVENERHLREQDVRIKLVERRFEEQFRHSPIPTYTWQKRGDDFALIDVNDAAVEITDGRIRTLLGINASRMYDSQPEMIRAMRQAAAEGVVRLEIDYEFVSTPLQRRLAITFAPVPPDLVILHTIDVTEERRAQQAIADREEYFRSLIENGSDVIGVLDVDGTLVYSSPSVIRVLGYRPDEVVGMSTLEFIVPGQGRARWEEHLRRQAAEPSRTLTIEIDVQHKDGSPRSWEVVTKGIVTGGMVTGMIANCRDITERKSIMSRLEQAGRIMSLGRLAATIAHEINNVLMGIMPFAEIIQRKAGTDGAIQRAASQIVSSIGRGRRVTQEILRFTQAVPPAFRLIDLGDFLEGLGSEARALLGDRIRFELRPPAQPTFVWADPHQLGQVITNLLLNACEAIEGPGSVTIVAAPENRSFGVSLLGGNENGELAHVSITDSGPGIPQSVLHHIFEPLFTTKAHGTGLGLAVAHQIMTQHKGEIFAESHGDSGTTFHLYLPRAEAGPATKSDTTNETGPGSRRRRVLMVEDDESVAMGISMLLEDQGFEVRVLSRGADTVPSIERSIPDLVILDVGLPDRSGVDVYQELRERWPDLPVIFSTGHLHQTFDAKDVHVTSVLKPYTIEALMEAMEKVGSLS
jgi:PAS domain S-box-containing protein